MAFLLGHRDATVTRVVYVQEIADARRHMRRSRMTAEFAGALAPCSITKTVRNSPPGEQSAPAPAEGVGALVISGFQIASTLEIEVARPHVPNPKTPPTAAIEPKPTPGIEPGTPSLRGMGRSGSVWVMWRNALVDGRSRADGRVRQRKLSVS